MLQVFWINNLVTANPLVYLLAADDITKDEFDLVSDRKLLLKKLVFPRVAL